MIAVAWQIGQAILERRLNREGKVPSLLRLLFTAEIEVLRALRAELKGSNFPGDETRATKLFQVEQRLRELGDYG
ncbi:hypothetical protein [Candidatus Hadarchaeum sp.]|uniref:hypothetical protein n=1 Tax=Candidatus Hadarchaeum sp. TaxID=2883567 RepID=UPI003D0C8389